MWITFVSSKDQLSVFVNMLMYKCFHRVSTQFLPYRQPAFAGTWFDSCHVRGRHKRNTLYLRVSIMSIQLYTRILLFGVFMCEIYGGLKCAGSISNSFQCDLVCGSFGGNVQLVSNKLRVRVYSDLHNFSVCAFFHTQKHSLFYASLQTYFCLWSQHQFWDSVTELRDQWETPLHCLPKYN
jgi:hypothetical protein